MVRGPHVDRFKHRPDRRPKRAHVPVAKLDRLSRSMIDFTGLMGRATKQNWALVALDCAVDTTTPAGEAMAKCWRPSLSSSGG